jgi:glycosyltransferase involved in cell wall biosynthesis
MAEIHGKQELYPLSVVIATLGGEALWDTLSYLNNGDKIPFEILVCIPEENFILIEKSSQGNVKIVRTPCRGQVAQRAYGLQRACQPFVLQLDDDIVLRPDDLQLLLKTLRQLGPGHALAPLFRLLPTGQNATEYHPGVSGWLQSFYAFFICGAPWGTKKMGVISSAGIGYGVDRKYCGPDIFETQWLPGACVLCHREDVVTEDYYPFAGKAYTEDLVHSVLWRQKGVRLWVHPDAYCGHLVVSMPFSLRSANEVLRAHGYVVKLIGGKMWQLKLWYIINVLKQALLLSLKRVLRK